MWISELVHFPLSPPCNKDTTISNPDFITGASLALNDNETKVGKYFLISIIGVKVSPVVTLIASCEMLGYKFLLCLRFMITIVHSSVKDVKK